jgi:manganese/zinc/iron transport system substrate-binding protein
MVRTHLFPLLLLLVLVGCDSSDVSPSASVTTRSADARGPISAIATVGMVGDLVRNVGGQHVTVTQIMGAGVDPHLYKATRDDVQTIMQGDMVFYAGLMLEGKMADTLIKVARGKPVIAVTEKIDPGQLLEPEDFAGHYDPHLWMDVAAWSHCVDVVADALAEFDAGHAQQYKANAEAYKSELAALHQYGLDAISSIPADSRILVTSHDAFNYFGRAYGMEVLGVQGLSTESEAGLQRINELVDLLVEKKVPAVFVESSVSRKNIESLIEGANAQGHRVVVGGELFSDAMGSSGTYEGTYLGMLDHNITLVARGLGGQAPRLGYRDQLSAER